MADALCGPSNALRSFQKHTQVDRTLQQDRLTGPRQSPSQGFRSFDPRSGSLDADFHAFENAQPHPFRVDEGISSPQLHHGPMLSQPMIPGASMNWANDFQNMHIADQPVSAQHFRTEAPLVRSAPGGWQTEFMRQRPNGASAVAQGKQAVYEQQSFDLAPMQQFPMYSGFQQQLSQVNAPIQGELQQGGQPDLLQGADQYAHVDWSTAFDEAFKDVSQVDQAATAQYEQILHQDGAYTNDRSQMNDNSLIHEPESVRIGSDAIAYTETQDRSADHESQDASALARVAGELLHNLQHETDDKFQNSQFLDLMRKIRDRQVEVKNNTFESAQADTVVATHDHLPNQEAPSQKPDDFAFPDMNAIYEPRLADAVDYTFDSDQSPSNQVPLSQMQELHPGGRLYPASPEQQFLSMSGGVGPAGPVGLDVEDGIRGVDATSTSLPIEQRTSLA